VDSDKVPLRKIDFTDRDRMRFLYKNKTKCKKISFRLTRLLKSSIIKFHDVKSCFWKITGLLSASSGWAAVFYFCSPEQVKTTERGETT